MSAHSTPLAVLLARSLTIPKKAFGVLFAVAVIVAAKWAMLFYLNLQLEPEDYVLLLLLEPPFVLFVSAIVAAARGLLNFYSPLLIISLASTYPYYVKPAYIIINHTEAYDLVSPEALIYFAVYQVLFFGAYLWFGYTSEQSPAPDRDRATPKTRALIQLLWFGWLLSFLFLALRVVESGGLMTFLFEQSYVDKTAINTEMSYGEHLTTGLLQAAFYMPLCLLAYYHHSRRRILTTLLLVVSIILVPLSLLVFSHRRGMLGMLMAFALIYVARPKRALASVLIILLLLSPFALTYWAALRGIPLGEIDQEKMQERVGHVQHIMFNTPELSMMDEYLKIFRDLHGELPMRWGVDYYKIFLVPIPREVLPTKPFASGTEFLRIYYPDWYFDIGGAVTISAPGELLWNLSYAGLLGAIAYGWFFSYIDRKWLNGTTYQARFFYIIGGFSLLFGYVRGGHHLVLLEFLAHVWPLIAAGILIFLARYFRVRSAELVAQEAAR